MAGSNLYPFYHAFMPDLGKFSGVYFVVFRAFVIEPVAGLQHFIFLSRIVTGFSVSDEE